MIHEIGVELNAILADNGCPLRVVDGPEPDDTTTGARERIVLEHDEQTGDRFDPSKSLPVNPRQRGVVVCGAMMTIYAQSPSANATEWEHRRRAEHVRDLLLTALYQVLKVRKNRGFSIGKMGFTKAKDFANSPEIPGAVYELRFSFERSINEYTWAGEKQPEGSPTAIQSKTNVYLINGPEGTQPETGCGG